MKKNILILKGDGVGPEIVDEAIKVLKKVEKKFSHEFNLTYADFGGASIDKHGIPLTDETIQIALNSDSVLLGAVGGYKWENIEQSKRPEMGLLKLRKELNLYANIRPTKFYSQLSYSSPLKESITSKKIDFVIVRELTGGIYFGKKETEIIDGKKIAHDVMTYSEDEIRRIGIVAFEMALKLNKNITSVDKANVLHSSKLWREVMEDISKSYKSVPFNNMFVDNAAMQIISNPSQFGIMVTENMFGDILSDEASVITGSIGMAPSASLSSTTLGMYEPIHGSAPDIAGKNIANPIATIMSVAMMLKLSFGMNDESLAIENAVLKALDNNYRTVDIMPKDEKYKTLYNETTCSDMGDAISSFV